VHQVELRPESWLKSAIRINRALSADGNPGFATVVKVINALGLKIHNEAART
jgi:DNA-binding phage protein